MLLSEGGIDLVALQSVLDSGDWCPFYLVVKSITFPFWLCFYDAATATITITASHTVPPFTPFQQRQQKRIFLFSVTRKNLATEWTSLKMRSTYVSPTFPFIFPSQTHTHTLSTKTTSVWEEKNVNSFHFFSFHISQPHSSSSWKI